MKLNHLISNDKPGRVIQTFGNAKLLKHSNGKHELVGGSPADFAAARDWVSFVAHEIVFSQTGGATSPRPTPTSKSVVFRFHARLTGQGPTAAGRAIAS